MRKDVVGYEGLYEVDTEGNIYSLRFDKVKALKQYVWGDGYHSIGLRKNNKAKTKRVQRIVAEAFLPDYTEDLQVDHIDEDKSNNKSSNLRMLTNKENSIAYYLNNKDVINSGNKGKEVTVDGTLFFSAYAAAKYIVEEEEKLGNTRTNNTISKEIRRFLAGKRPSWVMYGLYTIGY